MQSATVMRQCNPQSTRCVLLPSFLGLGTSDPQICLLPKQPDLLLSPCHTGGATSGPALHPTEQPATVEVTGIRQEQLLVYQDVVLGWCVVCQVVTCVGKEQLTLPGPMFRFLLLGLIRQRRQLVNCTMQTESCGRAATASAKCTYCCAALILCQLPQNGTGTSSVHTARS